MKTLLKHFSLSRATRICLRSVNLVIAQNFNHCSSNRIRLIEQNQSTISQNKFAQNKDFVFLLVFLAVATSDRIVLLYFIALLVNNLSIALKSVMCYFENILNSIQVCQSLEK